jgi:hypothetical protein
VVLGRHSPITSRRCSASWCRVVATWLRDAVLCRETASQCSTAARHGGGAPWCRLAAQCRDTIAGFRTVGAVQVGACWPCRLPSRVSNNIHILNTLRHERRHAADKWLFFILKSVVFYGRRTQSGETEDFQGRIRVRPGPLWPDFSGVFGFLCCSVCFVEALGSSSGKSLFDVLCLCCPGTTLYQRPIALVQYMQIYKSVFVFRFQCSFRCLPIFWSFWCVKFVSKRHHWNRRRRHHRSLGVLGTHFCVAPSVVKRNMWVLSKFCRCP